MPLTENPSKVFLEIVPDISKCGTHSMIAGGATLAANAGVPERQLQRHGRWKSTTAKERLSASCMSCPVAPFLCERSMWRQ